MRFLTAFLIVACCTILSHTNFAKAQILYKPSNDLVYGGQFKDIFLPMPLNGKLVGENIWGAENVLPRDIKNGIEDNEWCYWGGNPVLGKDGKYHIAICRWLEETGHWGWPESEVAHAVSKSPTGPYKVMGTVIEKGHNPEVIRLSDGTYILHISGAKVYTSDKLSGPWNLLGKLEIDTRGYKGLSHLETNLTGVERKDGSFLFFTKRGDVMISNTGILGPFKMVSAHNYNRYTGYPEDPVIWKSLHQYHVVYNHAIEKKSIYMRSLDGIEWIVEPGTAYDNFIFKYTDGSKNTWAKFERPKVLQDELGRATHLTLGVIDVSKQLDLGNDKHSSKHIVLPLQVERKIEIVNPDKIGEETQEVKIRIKAEEGFNPKEEVVISSLLLGTSNVVNFGKGATPIKGESENNDLIVTFNWNGMSIPNNYYDLKLLGETKSDALVYGYALLPGFSENPASLVTVPLKVFERDGSKILSTSVENVGLKTSNPCKLQIFKYATLKREIVKEIKVSSLKPYEDFKIEFPVDEVDNVEFEAILVDLDVETDFWNKVDQEHYTVVFKGVWKTNSNGKDIYMGTEKVAKDKGASATFFFTGTQARCYGNISKLMGKCDVFINDNYMETIDCFFGADIHNTVLYQTPILKEGLHKLELCVDGKHYKEGEEGPIAIDAFSYR